MILIIKADSPMTVLDHKLEKEVSAERYTTEWSYENPNGVSYDNSHKQEAYW